MQVDKCEHCGGDVYPDDEKIFWDHGFYHIECAEDLNLPDEEE